MHRLRFSIIRRLEVDLKQALFTRHGQGVALTEGGKAVLGHARKIIEQVEMLNLDLDQDRFLISPARKAPVAVGAQVPFKSLARLPLTLSSSNHLHSINAIAARRRRP